MAGDAEPTAPRAGAAAAPETTTILAADVGRVFTKVYLLDVVEGERRLVSLARVPSIGDDGVPALVAALERATQEALSLAGRDASGHDGARVLLSSDRTTRVMVVAHDRAMGQAAAAALDALPVRVLPVVLLSRRVEDVLAVVEAESPDVVVVAGRARGDDWPRVRAAVEALGAAFAPPPSLVLAGDEAFVNDAAVLAGDARRAAAAGGSDGGSIDAVSVATAVSGAIAERSGVAGALPATVPRWSEAITGSAASGVAAATEMIADRYDVDVLTLDLGAGHALGVLATGTTGQRRVVARVREDLGVRLGRQTILAEAGVASITRWLPVDLDEETLRVDARRLAHVPAALAESTDELLLDQAYAREALRLLVSGFPSEHPAGNGLPPSTGGLPPIDLLIGSGGALALVPRLMQAVMILLDAVQPGALTQLALDRATALPLLGRLGTAYGAGSVGAALERDGLLNLGLCVAPVGTGREGETAIKVEVAYASRSPIVVEVSYGAIEVIPLPLGERASLKLWPAKEFDVGLGQGNAATPRAEVEGGAAGIIVDARGRPLVLPESAEKRQAKLLQWLQATGAYAHLSFVESGPPAEQSTPDEGQESLEWEGER